MCYDGDIPNEFLRVHLQPEHTLKTEFGQISQSQTFAFLIPDKCLCSGFLYIPPSIITVICTNQILPQIIGCLKIIFAFVQLLLETHSEQ